MRCVRREKGRLSPPATERCSTPPRPPTPAEPGDPAGRPEEQEAQAGPAATGASPGGLQRPCNPRHQRRPAGNRQGRQGKSPATSQCWNRTTGLGGAGGGGVPRPVTGAGSYLEQELSQAPACCPAQAAAGMSPRTRELARGDSSAGDQARSHPQHLVTPGQGARTRCHPPLVLRETRPEKVGQSWLGERLRLETRVNQKAALDRPRCSQRGEPTKAPLRPAASPSTKLPPASEQGPAPRLSDPPGRFCSPCYSLSPTRT